MGTRADFYVGRGESAKWLGSIAWDGYEIPDELRNAKTEQAFKKALRAFAKTRDDWTSPQDGWPWPWDDSGTTDEVYAFAGDRVWQAGGYPVARWFDSAKGKPNFRSDETRERWWAKKPVAVFPNMKSKQNVTYGKRSGLIVIGG